MDLDVIQGTGALTYTAGPPEQYAAAIYVKGGQSIGIGGYSNLNNYYYNGGLYLLTTPSTNTSTNPTVNINDIGPVPVLKNGSTAGSSVAIAAGDIPANNYFILVYNQALVGGTGAFVLLRFNP